MFNVPKIIVNSLLLICTINAQDRYESFPTWIESIPEYGFTGMKYSLTQKSNLLILGTAGFGALIANRFDDQIQYYTHTEDQITESFRQLKIREARQKINQFTEDIIKTRRVFSNS